MTESTTTNYSWTKPELQKSPTTWGKFINDDLDSIDSIVFSNQQGLSPVGAGALWFIATPPANWLICNGQTLDISVNPQYTALKNLIGYTYGGSGNQFMLPNLTQTFPLGAGPNPVGSSGGAFAVALTTANLPPHAHPITDVAHNHGVNQWAHAHSIATGGHAHTISAQHSHGSNLVKSGAGTAGLTPGGVFPIAGSGNTDPASPGNTDAVGNLGGNTDVQTSGVSLNASGTGLSTTQNVGSGAAFNVVPPFLAIYFIVRYQ